MLTGDAPDPPQTLTQRLFRGRRLGPLLAPWISSVIFAALVYYAELTMPALHDVAGPIYWLLVIVVVVATWRWLRGREAERRSSDRRSADRRGRVP